MVAVSLIAGDQVPVILLFDVVGKAANTSPLQIGPTEVKVGVTGLEFTVMVMVVVVAH